jgi:hypothetical protein
MIIILIICIIYIFVGKISVPTGNVVVWYSWRVMHTEVSEPGGLKFYNPITTGYQLVDVTSQKDEIKDIHCVTKDKQKAIFPSVMVWNRLPKDKVYGVLSVFEKFYSNPSVPYDRAIIYDPVINFVKEVCSEYTGEELRSDNYKDLNEMIMSYLVNFQKSRPEMNSVLNDTSTGLDILKVFVEIPKLSDEVEKNYQEIAAQKSATLAEEYRQKTELKKRETENKLDFLDAEKNRKVAEEKNKESEECAESESKIRKIKAESDATKKRIESDANSYALSKLSSDNKLLLTPEYIQLKQVESFGCNNAIYYGDSIPTFISNPYNSVPTNSV